MNNLNCASLIRKEMQGLNDSLTVGVVVTLVFGALFFYLYSRLVQNEKRVNLIESILLDLKMSADANYTHGNEDSMDVEGVEPISGPEPLDQADVDEDAYKQALEQVPTATSRTTASSQAPVLDVSGSEATKGGAKVQPNYASMTVKELKALAKQRGLSLSSNAGRKELTESLRKLDGTVTASVATQPQMSVTQSTVEGALASEGGAPLDEAEAENL
jgi:hypothetical protein